MKPSAAIGVISWVVTCLALAAATPSTPGASAPGAGDAAKQAASGATSADGAGPTSKPAAPAQKPPATRPSDAPTTRPAAATGDAAIDFLLGAAIQTPSTQPAPGQTPAPATRPVNPFVNRGDGKDADIRPGVLVLSGGEKIRGKFATTPDKPVRVWIEKEKAYRDIPFRHIKSADAKVLWERDEKEWRFRESGSDIKEYSGKTYPVRELEYTFTLADGTTVHGGVVAPIHLQTREGHVTFVLYKRQKGEVGQSLKDLHYVGRVELE